MQSGKVLKLTRRAVKMGKNEDKEKKVKGINRFLYRGYEVYDEDADRRYISNSTSESSVEPNMTSYSDSSSKALTPGSESICDAENLNGGAEKKKESLYRKRQIQDDKVWENLNKISDPVVRGSLSSSVFHGTVNQLPAEIKVSSGKNSIVKRSLISEIISIQQHIELNNDLPSYVVFDAGKDKSKRIVSPRLIVFLKALVVTQFNVCEEFSEVVAAFFRSIINQVDHKEYFLPILIPVKSKLQDVVVRELNEYCKMVYDEAGVKYTEMIVASTSAKGNKKNKDAVESLIDSANLARG